MLTCLIVSRDLSDLLMSSQQLKHSVKLKDGRSAAHLRATSVQTSSGLRVALLATISVLIAFGKDIKGEKIMEVFFRRTAWRKT